ncbi:MAG: MerR family transcriptional regulator [Chloroflexaceae bacterium]|nr:MerR family transcriptional regulator [Chloroflexaceae bacterium]
MKYQSINLEEIAIITQLPVTVIQRYTELGLIAADEHYSETDLGELRCVRRLMDDLGLEHDAIEVLLRMRQRILQLQQEMAILRSEIDTHRSRQQTTIWIEADWRDLSG